MGLAIWAVVEVAEEETGCWGMMPVGGMPPPPFSVFFVAMQSVLASAMLASAERPSLDFPPIERTTLSNGMKVVFARRSAVPVV
jgi:hypothetical protein